MPHAAYNIYIVCGSDEIFHSIILFGKLRVMRNLSQNVRAHVRLLRVLQI